MTHLSGLQYTGGIGFQPILSVYWRKEMITVEQKEQIRRAFYVEGRSIRQIQRETGYHRQTIQLLLMINKNQLVEKQ